MIQLKGDINDELLEILSNYQGIIYKVCWIYFKNKDDRDENFQEVLYQILKSYSKLKDKSKIGSWIYRVSIFTSIIKLRKESLVSYQNELPDLKDESNFEKELHQNEDIKRLYEAIYKLNDIEKAIIMLYLDEKDYDEISEITGLSKTNVGVKIMRIKEKLKELLTN